MATCKYCGQEVKENQAYCSNCGAEQIQPQQTAPQQAAPQPQYTAPQYNAPQYNAAPQVVDNGGFGWGLLGCCIPLVGLILFLIWKDTKPKSAKAAGIGALVSVIISVVYYVVIIAAGVASGVVSGY